MKNRFSFFTELSSQSRRPGLPPGFPEHGSASRLSDETAPGSRLAANRDSAAAWRVLRGVLYQTTNNEYRPLDRSAGAIVKDQSYYIGRNDRGILRPIFNQQREMIIVDAETGEQYLLFAAQAAELGMNLPLPGEGLNRARIAARRRNRGRNN